MTGLKTAGPIWLLTGCSAMLILALVLSHQGGALRVALPVCMTLIGLACYQRSQGAYLQLVLWSWLLTPLVRRLIDYHFGFADQNLVLLIPLLLTGISGLAIFESARRLRELTPFLLCITGILYGFVIGLLRHASGDVVYGLFNWLGPVLLGMNIYLNWPLYLEQKRVIQRTIGLGILAVGGYGIYQYYAPPPWDVYWWESLPFGTAASFGQPIKYLIRVWSTLNAPAPFAGVMGNMLLLNFASSSRMRTLCALVGISAFALSLSRTEWLACMIGVIFLVFRGSRQFVAKTVFGVILLGAICLPLLSIGPAQKIISQRFQSMQHLSQDDSLNTRQAMYKRVTGDLLREPFGEGVSNALYYGGYTLDSGLLRFLLNLGVLGSAFYAVGLFQILTRLLPKQAFDDPLPAACGAVLISAFAKIASLSAFENAAGATVWLCIGLGLAALRFHGAPVEVRQVEERFSYAA